MADVSSRREESKRSRREKKMRRTNKRARTNASIDNTQAVILNMSSSPSLALSSTHPSPSSYPIYMLREIERCLICHFLDLPSIASLLCTSKFFSVAGFNIVLWRPVLSFHTVQLLSLVSSISFCRLSPVVSFNVGRAVVRLELSDEACTQELFEHLIHLPQLSHLTFPLPPWLAAAVANLSRPMYDKVAKTVEQLCTCLNSVTMLASPRLYDSLVGDAFNELMNRFGKSNIRRLRISSHKDVVPLYLTELTFPSMEELIIDVPLGTEITLGSHYNILQATYDSFHPRSWTLDKIVSAMFRPDVHVHTLIVPATETATVTTFPFYVPHPLPVLRILPDEFDSLTVAALLRALPHVLRLELSGIEMLNCVIENMHTYPYIPLCPDLQQIQLIGGTVEQQQEYQLKLDELCNQTDRKIKNQRIELVLE